MFEVAIIILAIFAIAYFILINLFILGWNLNRFPKKKSIQSPPFVSIVVAIRNEEKNLPALLRILSSQKYPNNAFEVILSDDCSTDNSCAVIKKFIVDNQLWNFTLLLSEDKNRTGKKHALKRAIMASRGEIILTSDADCRMSQEWLATMIKVFQLSDAQMAVGPVMIDLTVDRIFTRFQALEFLSLTGSTGGAIKIGHPIMCNGANMAFRKIAWQKCEPATAGKEFQSGDDVFLLHAFKREYPGKIHFIKKRDAIVHTQPSQSISEFFSQRSRWAGKSGGYTDAFTLTTGLVVAGFNIMLFAYLFISVLTTWTIIPLFPVMISKMLIDGIMLWKVAKFGRQKHLLKLFPLLSLIYPFYVTTTLVLAVFTRPDWKQRKT
jgi:poly-beta-1,6-N-acetyl-D-glucosamine synthase